MTGGSARACASPRIALVLLAFALPGLLPPEARAHRDDYIDETFVYMTLGRHEVELEGWAEVRRLRAHETAGWYTGAFEYGVTDRWTLDGAAQTVHRGGRFDFGRLRFETRYRFAEEGAWPLDLAASLEYEHETAAALGGEAEDVLTPRVVVSKDVVPDLNTTLNLDFPVSLSGPGDVAFAYGLGLRYPAESFARFGTELKQEPSDRTATIFPQVWFALPREVTFKVGTGIGLTHRTDPLVVRVVVEAEL